LDFALLSVMLNTEMIGKRKELTLLVINQNLNRNDLC